MLALVIVDTFCVVLLAVLVAGLLRSHADILRALHSLGAGVGDPNARPSRPLPADRPQPLTIGPALAPNRHSTSVYDVAGVTPDGDALSVSATAGPGSALLVFLSSGCTTCSGIWRSLVPDAGPTLPAGLRVVVVTKGPELESPGEVRRLAPPGATVVMSSEAWSDYEVPGSPFFVLLDTASGRRMGEGVANHLSQVVQLVERARADGAGAGERDRTRLDGPEREAENDRILTQAGVLPGDPSLYPTQLDDVFAGHTGHSAGGRATLPR
jgi:hypothetical protein